MFEERVREFVVEAYGGVDRGWLAACRKAAPLSMLEPEIDLAWKYDYNHYKTNAFIEKRGPYYKGACALMKYYGIDRTDRIIAISGSKRFNFKTDKHTTYPYVCCAILRLVEEAQANELHVLPEPADDEQHGDLQEDPLVYVVQDPR